MKTFALAPLTVPASAIGLGTMIFHPDTKDRDFALLDAFVAGGGTYIDIAEVYGSTEEYGYSEMVIGDWLAARPGMRERIILTSKGLIPGYCAPIHPPDGAHIDPDSIHRAIDGSLKRLKVECLDIWMFHRDDPSHPVGPLLDALDEELKAGRLKAFGASNWSVARIRKANAYAQKKGRTPMICSSPHFSLAKANEPFWPDTVVTNEQDKAWFNDERFPLIAWSSLGRGFFAHGDPVKHDDPDLVRVFYSDENFTRKQRAHEFADAKGLSMFEVALGYVINQSFPVVALCGPQTPEEVASCTRAGDLTISKAECDWLDLTSDDRPF
ncbi:MAG: aldo/keto reductase [Pseudomonadota bacterium]